MVAFFAVVFAAFVFVVVVFAVAFAGFLAVLTAGSFLALAVFRAGGVGRFVVRAARRFGGVFDEPVVLAFLLPLGMICFHVGQKHLSVTSWERSFWFRNPNPRRVSTHHRFTRRLEPEGGQHGDKQLRFPKRTWKLVPRAASVTFGADFPKVAWHFPEKNPAKY